jgi:hypothetical protein
LIESLDVYRKRTRKGETVDQDDTNEDGPAAEDDLTELFPVEIKCLTSTAIWPQSADQNAELTLDVDKLAPDSDILELEALTGCRLVKVLNESKIYIGGDSEKDCALVLGKLDHLRKYRVSSTILWNSVN